MSGMMTSTLHTIMELIVKFLLLQGYSDDGDCCSAAEPCGLHGGDCDDGKRSYKRIVKGSVCRGVMLPDLIIKDCQKPASASAVPVLEINVISSTGSGSTLEELESYPK